MVAFPWDNLITAASTLAAALGGVSLKERGDRKERRAEASMQDELARIERRRVAYADMVTTAGDMQLYYGQMIALRQRYMADHQAVIARSREGAETGKQLNRAIAMVQLVGSDPARTAARAVHNATAAVGRTLEPAREIDHEAANAAATAMFRAVDAFLDAVRPETAEVDPARGNHPALDAKAPGHP